LVLDLDARYGVRASRPLPSEIAVQLPVEGWLDGTSDDAVTICASLAHRALDQGRNIGLITTGAHYDVLPADRSDRQYLKMLETLAVVQADGHRPLSEVLAADARRFSRNSTVIIITSSTEEDWIRALSEIAARHVRVVAVIVEAETFGPAPSALMTVSGLVAAGISAHLVKYGDAIGAALANGGKSGANRGQAAHG
jgi:uncharacterized protein (DUF58 family)